MPPLLLPGLLDTRLVATHSATALHLLQKATLASLLRPQTPVVFAMGRQNNSDHHREDGPGQLKTVSRKARARLSARSDSPASISEAFADFDPAKAALRNALSLQSSRAGSPAPPRASSRRRSRPVSHANSSDGQYEDDGASLTDETRSRSVLKWSS